MRTRILVGLVGLPIVLTLLWLGGVWMALLVLVAALIGGYEMYAMLAHGGYRPLRWFGLFWLCLLTLSGWRPDLLPMSLLLSAGLITTLTICLFLPEQPISTWLSTSAATIYLGLVLSQGLALRLLPQGLWWVLLAILITWASDTAAYFAGVFLGRHKFWPRLSPKKTWEGTIGGWLGGIAAGALVASLAPLPITILSGAAIGFAGGVLALFGDLSISMMKRQVGVKDTGAIFPGHGGMLDRLDSILFVIPFVYQVALWLQT